LILESFGREYIGAYNTQLDGGHYQGYTPFVDSLIDRSVTYEFTFGNGRKSVDGMPSILSSIPRFIEPFFLTPASLNDVSGLAEELGKLGYYSAFFHGAENGSMGFEAFAHATGYTDYFGRTEYNQDARFKGDEDFDGMWAIWDEEFLQFYALKMSEMQQPFFTTVFTASSHHPYVVPERYRDIYKDEPGDDNIMHKCIRYTDHSLQLFFETASQQPWYENTLFVLTADHTNLSSRQEYQTEMGLVSVPLIVFDPSGQLQP
jgi:phosphoglycerol transferase MdoB-like AlkP superfamily enzyme